MARLDIQIWQNEYDLYDYLVSLNGVNWSTGDNFRTERLAYESAVESGQEGWAVRGNN